MRILRMNLGPKAVGPVASAMLGLALLAFWPMYLSKPFAGIDSYTHLHAAMGTSWLLLVIIQAHLIRRGRRSTHRSLGWMSLLVGPAFVLSSVLLAHQRFSSMDSATFAREAYTLYLPLSAALLFAAALFLALWYRRTAPLHGRFMACTVLLTVDPVVGRVLAFYVVDLPQFWHYQIITFGIEIAVLAGLCLSIGWSDRAKPFWWFAASYGVILVMWFIAPTTAPWLAFATWFRGGH